MEGHEGSERVRARATTSVEEASTSARFTEVLLDPRNEVSDRQEQTSSREGGRDGSTLPVCQMGGLAFHEASLSFFFVWYSVSK